MARVARLDLVHKAIASGIANIEWKDSAYNLVLADPRLRSLSLTPKGIRLLLHQFVSDGNCLTVRTETRKEKLEDDPDCSHWYRAIIPFNGLPHGLFVEVLLLDDEEENDPVVQIVSSHERLA